MLVATAACTVPLVPAGAAAECTAPTTWASSELIVVLKRLSEALRDGDRIAAVVLGTATNQDGASGFKDNGAAQEKVYIKALQHARITPEEVSYIECHGTGTSWAIL